MTHPRDKLWNKVRNTAAEVYSPIQGYEDWDAMLTADAAADSWYAKQGMLGGLLDNYRKRQINGLPQLPDPGNTLSLGLFLSVESVTADGTIHVYEFDAKDKVPLLWSHDLQACLVFPYLPPQKCNLPPTSREDQLARVWAKGRPAKCAVGREYPRPAMPYAEPGICISYRSDKFSHGVCKDYIHHFEAHVIVYRSRPGPERAPTAFLVRGGKLRLTEHGLDG